MAANTAMQGAYIPQYAHVQTSAVPIEVRALTAQQPDVCKTLSSFKQLPMAVAKNKGYFTLSSRKMVHNHKWTHLAIIPHIRTNKPSSAEVTFGQQLKQSCLEMQISTLFCTGSANV